MICKKQIYQIDPKNLTLARSEIYRTMGYRNAPEQQIIDDIEKLIHQSFNIIKIKAGYSFINQDRLKFKEHCLFIDEEKFECGKIIYNQIKNASELFVFLATLGNEFDNFIQELFDSGDFYEGYLADTIGSVIVEAAIDWMCRKETIELEHENKNCTNRFSPGYCNWDIAEQQKLFKHLPKNFLGVELLPSSLMKPIKSVSGIIGIGENVKKMPYTCNICNQENCIMRREKNKETT